MGLFDLDHPWKLSHLAYPIGITLMLITSSLFKGSRIVILQRLGWLSALLSLGLMVALLLTGTRYRGATYAAGQLTPTEIIKLLMVLFLASALASREKAIRKSLESKGERSITLMILPIYLVFACLVGLLILQRDLGMVMILALMLCLVLFFLTGQWRYVILSSGGMVLAGWIAQSWLSHARGRIQTWLDPSLTQPERVGKSCRGSQACLPVAFGVQDLTRVTRNASPSPNPISSMPSSRRAGFCGMCGAGRFLPHLFSSMLPGGHPVQGHLRIHSGGWHHFHLGLSDLAQHGRRHQGHPHDRHSIAVGQPWWEQSGNRVYRPGIVAQSIRIRRTLSIEGLQTAAQAIEQSEIRLTLQCSSPIKARVSAPQKRRSSAFARRAFRRLHGLHRA